MVAVDKHLNCYHHHHPSCGCTAIHIASTPPMSRRGLLSSDDQSSSTSVWQVAAILNTGFIFAFLLLALYFLCCIQRWRGSADNSASCSSRVGDDTLHNPPQNEQQQMALPVGEHTVMMQTMPNTPLGNASNHHEPPAFHAPTSHPPLIYAYQVLHKATGCFSEANLLGKGGFGPVYKGELPNGQVVAIKCRKEGSSQGDREFCAEVEIISRIHHKNLISLLGYCINGVQKLLVYEFVPNHSLSFHLHGKKAPNMNWETRMKIALGSAQGLEYLHEHCDPRIVHRDIKADNILLNSSFEPKVADFGLARYCPNPRTHVSTRPAGTFGYIAPEIHLGGKHSDKSDIFSFGVVLLELMSGRKPILEKKAKTLADWARPLLEPALESGNFDKLAYSTLKCNYNPGEMARMPACAFFCVNELPACRPQMSQVVRVLDGTMPPKDLIVEDKPGNGAANSPSESSDSATSSYKTALENLEHSTSTTSVYMREVQASRTGKLNFTMISGK